MKERREQIITFVKDNFIGPLLGIKNEVIEDEFPRNHYYSGILFPDSTGDGVQIKAKETEITEFLEFEKDAIDEFKSSRGEFTEKTGSCKTDESNSDFLDNVEEDIISKSNTLVYQAAISITCIPDSLNTTKISVYGGWYEDLSTIKIEINESTGKEYKSKHKKFQRHEIEIKDIQLLSIINEENGYTLDLSKIPQCPLVLKLKAIKRESGIITVALINCSKSGKLCLDSFCLFQSELVIENEDGFKKISSNRDLKGNSDFESNMLLYKDKEVMASGHGCSVSWNENIKPCKKVYTTFMPQYELKGILFVHEYLANLNINFSMLKFANLKGNDNNENFATLKSLIDSYSKWIDEQFNDSELSLLNSRLKDTALKHKKECKKSLSRMEEGLELLKTNHIVLKAFNLMNQAMLKQQLHSKLPENPIKLTKNNKIEFYNKTAIPDINDESTWYNKENNHYGSWRPFQIAFILMNIKSLINPNSEEREIVDLIWFATGGGKTEAYLGLTAFIIFYRKLLNINDNGTRVIMRYTLRLLSTQQFSRATALICACEDIRSRNEDLLGKNRITCGYYVGNTTTPGSFKQAYEIVKRDDYSSSSLVLLKCPWCGAPLGKHEFDKPAGFTPSKHSGIPSNSKQNKNTKYFKYIGYNATPKSFEYICENPDCRFSSKDFPLPVSVIDEQLYKEPPTLLIGTVDKFAMLPFNTEASILFGDNGTIKNLPPDLIIQDELHLISGPLGSTVGIYETLISNLCLDANHHHPKIIASTATISMCEEQCKSLYGVSENMVKQFPPKGMSYRDSFFAVEDRYGAGRKYVGIMSSSNHSGSWSAIKLYAALSEAIELMEVKNEVDRDSYWTIVGYYNSLKELAKATTWATAEIYERYTVFRSEYLRKMDKDPKLIKPKRGKKFVELTSRADSLQITKDLKNLEDCKYDGKGNNVAKDYCFATNMISVGVDIGRLGLMVITGQPKTTSEYIQASSRVGRDNKNPGLVFTLYSATKPRDKSHYEQFQMYHSKIYSSVEPTSVTPFSEPLLKRTLHSIVITFVLFYRKKNNLKGVGAPRKELQDKITEIIKDRVLKVDPASLENVIKILKSIFNKWEESDCNILEVKSPLSTKQPLIYRAGDNVDKVIEENCFPVMTSMRSVDNECVVGISKTKDGR